MSTVEIPTATQGISYDDLYHRWERGHWLATEIDFTQDRIDWRDKMSQAERDAALWFFTLFFHGEDFVTDDLSPYVDAAPLESQTYFLTTQQVDEARHSVFFKRFFHEVVGIGDGTAGSGLAESEKYLTWGHRRMFEHLGKVAARLRKDHSPAMFAEGLFNYHIIVEGTLAQPGQHMLQNWLENADLLPGFREGMDRVSADEQRHIAFGVKALSELYADDPETVAARLGGTMRTVSQYLTDFAYPLNRDHDFVKPLGITLPELYADSMRSLGARLKGIGLTTAHQELVLPMLGKSFEEQGEQMLRLLEAGYFGSGTLPKSHDEDDLAIYFETLGEAMASRRPAAGTSLHFDFTDIPPRTLRIGGDGSPSVTLGADPAASVTLRIAFDDFLDLVADRANPLKLVFTRRMRVSGDRGLLIGRRALFGAPTGTTGEPGLSGLIGRFAG